MQAINFEKVRFSYGDGTFALNGIDFSVDEGEFVAVLGHNGSGKSTLARLADGLLTPSAGKITVFGMDAGESKNIFEIRKKVGIVFQNPDNQTVASIVEDDVAFGPENIGVPREEIGERISFALDAVGMSDFRHATPARLSGGQKQRIAIAGVLALKPRLMILDEATAMLDPRGRREVTDVILRLNREEKITVLLITHFPEEAMLADRALVMNRGEIVMEGKPVDVLCREEELETYNLALPRPVALCRTLRKNGLSVADSLDAGHIAEEIAESFSKKTAAAGAGRNENSAVETSLEDMPAGGRSKSDSFLSAKKEEPFSSGVGSADCKNLTYVYNNGSPFAIAALKGVDLEIGSGAFFGIIGHTGSGKSTFVQHLNALLKTPTAEKKYKSAKDAKKWARAEKKGLPVPPPIRLKVDGIDLTDKKTDFRALRSRVGMVFQYPEYQLFAETVSADVAFGLKNFAERPPTADEEKEAVRAALETVGLDYNEVKDRSPFELSGGQKRRVAIAGVIVTRPKILVLDEPAAGLDPRGKIEIMKLLHKIHREWCKTVIIVSHDMDEIGENCTDAAVFADGRVAMKAPPSELFRRTEELTALGLDVPFTAKITAELKARGIEILSDFTAENFAARVSEAYAGLTETGANGTDARRGCGEGGYGDA